jgi:hypothetical protein
MDGIYLVHTTRDAEDIIKDGVLRSGAQTSKLTYGDLGDTAPLNQVYFSLVDGKYNIRRLTMKYGAALIFDPTLLYTRKFWLANQWVGEPSGNLESSDIIVREYPRYSRQISSALTGAWKTALKPPNKRTYYRKTQVSILNQCSLNHLVAIRFMGTRPSDELLELIRTKYPSCVVTFTPVRKLNL